MNEELCCIEFLMVIAGRKQKSALLDTLSGAGAKLVHIMYGRGSVQASHLKQALGLVPEEQKVLIICLVPRIKLDGIFSMLNAQFHFEKPNTGIAFTMPVEKLSL